MAACPVCFGLCLAGSPALSVGRLGTGVHLAHLADRSDDLWLAAAAARCGKARSVPADARQNRAAGGPDRLHRLSGGLLCHLVQPAPAGDQLPRSGGPAAGPVHAAVPFVRQGLGPSAVLAGKRACAPCQAPALPGRAQACEAAGQACKINPGDGAFYGPKLDFHIQDSLGRVWQCGTIQLDMNLPERFDLTYIESDGSKQRPIMLHRVIYGSEERFIGILIEHYGGAFPLWLAPRQVIIVPVNPEIHSDYAHEIEELLLEQNIRVEVDDRNEKLGYRIREAQLNKIPVQLVIGDEEVQNRSVNIRRYQQKEQINCNLSDFVINITKERDGKY